MAILDFLGSSSSFIQFHFAGKTRGQVSLSENRFHPRTSIQEISSARLGIGYVVNISSSPGIRTVMLADSKLAM